VSSGLDISVKAIGSGGADGEDWEAYVKSQPAGTVYHRLAWRRIFGEGLGYPGWMLLARDQHGAVAGALPLYLVRGLRGRKLVAVPFRDRGGVLWDCPEAFVALVGEARRIGAEHGARAVQLKSIEPYPGELARQMELVETRYWVNSRVDLARYAGGDLLEGLGQKVRNMVRQASRQGLQAAVVEPDARGRDEWYDLHLRTQRKLGLPPFPFDFFRLMLDGLGTAGALRLCVVREGEKAVAACILLLHGRTAIYGYSASDPERQHSRPSDLMLYTAMQWLAVQGYAVFDLGSDAPSQEGLLFFKRKWLAAQASIPSYASGEVDAELSDSSAPRYRLARAALRFMPLPVLGSVASRFVRYFG
jgi:hypothetical protein